MTTTFFDPGTQIWVPRPAPDFVMPATVVTTAFKAGQPGRVQLQDGSEVSLSAAETEGLCVLDPQVFSPEIDDLINLNSLTNEAVLHKLRLRFEDDLIYTNVSSILVSVNPFKRLPLYTPTIMGQYLDRAHHESTPHIYSVGRNAYRNVLRGQMQQSIVISGESGAGKTECTKQILQYVAAASRRVDFDESAGSTDSLEQQILQANPLLEAFGNAKTLRNDNSSRFGKLVSVHISAQSGRILGGGIVDYLLEKSRVVQHQRGERNFHIFYQLLAGCAADADAAHFANISLLPAPEYAYLGAGGADLSINGASDHEQFVEVLAAMEALHIEEAQRRAIFDVVAAVLSIGNLAFEAQASTTGGDNVATPVESSLGSLARGAALLGVPDDDLVWALTNRKLAARGGQRGSVYVVQLSAQQAANARDAIVKHLYARLFAWLVGQINDSLAQSHGRCSSVRGSSRTAAASVPIHVLDIYGFEIFETNSFEQLCINYCNEKLQWFFNQHVFALEQAEYARQGVDTSSVRIEFRDNSECLALFDARPGILALLDEECMLNNSGSEANMLSKMLRAFAGHDYFAVPKVTAAGAQNCFGVKHFAGVVFYDVHDFLDKNRDKMHPDIEALFKKSSVSFVRQDLMLQEEVADTVPSAGHGRRNSLLVSGGGAGATGAGGAPRGGRSQLSVCAKFKSSLSTLLSDLSETQPHFVRCMKPNNELRPACFEGTLMQHQLLCNGLLEVCSIRKMGFPVRLTFEQFMVRYRVLARGQGDNVLHGALPDDVDSLIERLTVLELMRDGEWAKGTSKIFLRAAQADALESWEEIRAWAAQEIQRFGRGFVARRLFLLVAKTLDILASASAARSVTSLRAALATVDTVLPAGCQRLPAISKARALVPVIEREHAEKEKKVKELLLNAVARQSIASLEAALAAAAAASEELTQCSEAIRASALLDSLKAQAELKEEIEAAVAAPTFARLKSLLEQAASLGLFDSSVTAAQLAMQKLQDEHLEKLAVALGARESGVLRTLCEEAIDMGLSAHASVVEAQEYCYVLEIEHDVVIELVAAASAADSARLQAVIGKAVELGMEARCPEMVVAKKALAVAQAAAAIAAKVTGAMQSRSLPALKAALVEGQRTMGLSRELLEQAAELERELEREAELTGLLAALDAVGTGPLITGSADVRRRIVHVEKLLGQATEFASATAEVAAAARARLAKLQEVETILGELHMGIVEGGVPAIKLALEKGERIALLERNIAEFTQARETLAKLESQREAQHRLHQAVEHARACISTPHSDRQVLTELQGALADGKKFELSSADRDCSAARDLESQWAQRIELLTSMRRGLASNDLALLLDALVGLQGLSGTHWAALLQDPGVQRAQAARREMSAAYESGEPVLQNWLWKRGSEGRLHNASFKRRWFVLGGGELKYFAKPAFKRGDQLGSIVMTDVQEVRKGAVTLEGKFVLEIVTEGRTWILASTLEEERVRWLTKINAAFKLATTTAAGPWSAADGGDEDDIIGNTVLKEGSLLKKSHRMGFRSAASKWKPRYFVLKQGLLEYFEGRAEDGAGEKKGEIQLVGTGVKVERATDDQQQFALCLTAAQSSSSKPLLVAAQSEAEARAWREALEAAWQGNHGETGLALAASGDASRLRKLLANGAYAKLLNSADEFGKTALMCAAAAGDAACLKLLLLEADVDLHAQDFAGRDALMLAVSGGHYDCITALLAAGANANTRRHDGDTALHVAVRLGAESCVEALLQLGFMGADAGALDGGGKTALVLANEGGFSTVATMLRAEAPKVLRQPVGLGAPFGSRAMISCAVGGFPFPALQWSRDGAQQAGPVMAAGLHSVVGGSRSAGVGCEAAWVGSHFEREGEGHWAHEFSFTIHAVVDENLCGSYSATATQGEHAAQSTACEVSLIEGCAEASSTKASRVVGLTEVIAELANLALQCEWTPVFDAAAHSSAEPTVWQRRSADDEQESTTVPPQNFIDLKRRLSQEVERIDQLNDEASKDGRSAQIVHFECSAGTMKAGLSAAQHLADIGDVDALASLIQILTATILRPRLATAFVRSLRSEALVMLNAAALLYAPRVQSGNGNVPWWPPLACHQRLAVTVAHMLKNLARALCRTLGKLDGAPAGQTAAAGSGLHAHLIELLLLRTSDEGATNSKALMVELAVGEYVLQGLSLLAVGEGEVRRGELTTTAGRANVRLLVRLGLLPALCSRMQRTAKLFEQLQHGTAQDDSKGALLLSCRLLEQGCILLSNSMFDSCAITAGVGNSGLPVALVRVVAACNTRPEEKGTARKLCAALARTFEMACHALGNVTVQQLPQQLLLTPHPDETDESRLRCLQALVLAMECHRDDEEAMKAAIEVIGNFACAGEDDNDDESNAEDAFDKEALAAAPVHGNGSGPLTRDHVLVGEELARFAMQHVIDDGAVAAVVLAARTHKRSPALLLSSLDALCNMADDQDALSTMVTEGATACVMDVLSNVSETSAELIQSSEVELLQRALQLLAVLTECRAAVPMLTTIAGTRSLLTTMAIHSGITSGGAHAHFSEDTMELLLCAAVALENAAFDPQGVQELQEAIVAVTVSGSSNEGSCTQLDGVHVLLDLLANASHRAQSQLGSKDLSVSILRSLSNLCTAPLLAASICGANQQGDTGGDHGSSGLLTVIATMRAWSEDDEVLVAVFGLLTQLAHNVECAKRLSTAGVHRLALKLLKARHEAAGDLKRNPTTRTLLTSCLELLDLLATLLGEALALKLKSLDAVEIACLLRDSHGAQHKSIGKQCTKLLTTLAVVTRTFAEAGHEAAPGVLAKSNISRLDKLNACVADDDTGEGEQSIGAGSGLPPPPARPPAPSIAPPPPSSRPPAASIAPPPPPLPQTAAEQAPVASGGGESSGGEDTVPALPLPSEGEASAGAQPKRQSLLARRLSSMRSDPSLLEAPGSPRSAHSPAGRLATEPAKRRRSTLAKRRKSGRVSEAVWRGLQGHENVAQRQAEIEDADPVPDAAAIAEETEEEGEAQATQVGTSPSAQTKHEEEGPEASTAVDAMSSAAAVAESPQVVTAAATEERLAPAVEQSAGSSRGGTGATEAPVAKAAAVEESSLAGGTVGLSMDDPVAAPETTAVDAEEPCSAPAAPGTVDEEQALVAGNASVEGATSTAEVADSGADPSAESAVPVVEQTPAEIAVAVTEKEVAAQPPALCVDSEEAPPRVRYSIDAGDRHWSDASASSAVELPADASDEMIDIAIVGVGGAGAAPESAVAKTAVRSQSFSDSSNWRPRPTGPTVMDAASLAKLCAAVDEEENTKEERLATLAELGNPKANFLTCEQLKQVLSVIEITSERMIAAERAGPRVKDPENAVDIILPFFRFSDDKEKVGAIFSANQMRQRMKGGFASTKSVNSILPGRRGGAGRGGRGARGGRGHKRAQTGAF